MKIMGSLQIADVQEGMVLYGTTLNSLQVKHGFGRHIEYVIPQLSPVTMYTTLVSMENGIALFLIKTSVCIFVLRLIKGTYPRIRALLWVTIFILLTVTLAMELFFGLQCIPFWKVWHPKSPGKCISKSILTQVIRILGGTQ